MAQAYSCRLLRLHCHLPDESNLDEIYFKLDGEKVWPENENFRRTEIGVNEINLNLGKFEEGSRLDLELWDYDVISRNDHLGIFKLQIDGLGGPYMTELTEKSNSRIKYTLEWEID